MLPAPPPRYATRSGTGDAHALCVRGGVARSWGARNAHGQQGRSPSRVSPVPRPVRALLSEVVVEVAAGGAHSLFLTLTGEILGCGSDVHGQLGGVGGGGGGVRRLPHPHPARRVAAGRHHSVYLCRRHVRDVHFLGHRGRSRPRAPCAPWRPPRGPPPRRWSLGKTHWATPCAAC